MSDKLHFVWKFVSLTPPLEVFIAFADDAAPMRAMAHAVATRVIEATAEADAGTRTLKAEPEDLDRHLDLFPDEAETRWLVPKTVDAWGFLGGWVPGSELRFSREAAEKLADQMRRSADSHRTRAERASSTVL